MQSLSNRRTFLKLLSILTLTPLLRGAYGMQTGAPSVRPNEELPNILVFLFDALSARHLSLHGYRRETTPNLARFAERATVYHSHYSTSNFTSPGTASLLTGTYPWSHRAFNRAGIVERRRADRNLFKLLDGTHHRIAYPQNVWSLLLLSQFRDSIDTLLDPGQWSLYNGTLLARPFTNDADIAYRAVEDFLFGDEALAGSLLLASAHRLKTYVYEEFGLDKYEALYPRGLPFSHDRIFFTLEHVTDGLIRLLLRQQQPYIAFFHLFPPHDPYRPRREFIGIFEDDWTPVRKPVHPLSQGFQAEFLDRQRLEYDEYIAHMDAEFARLCDFMDQSGILESSYVVFTSDHGEMFERGALGHAAPLLHEPVIHIPLLISKPGQARREDVHTPTSSVDVLPTLLTVNGEPIPDWCEGQVLPLFGGERTAGERSIFALEAINDTAHHPLDVGTMVLIQGGYKLYYYFGYDSLEDHYALFDLTNDPEELEDLYPENGSVVADLRHELQQKLREVNEPYAQ
jgi:arylsulfatase A-like enzyme